MEKLFVNHTNHPSAAWSAIQKKVAEMYGKIYDFPFPEIDSEWDEETVRNFAYENCKRIMALQPAAVLCQGEFTYCHALINLLKEKGVLVLAACSNRETKEWQEDGKNVKKAFFTFIRFRAY